MNFIKFFSTAIAITLAASIFTACADNSVTDETTSTGTTTGLPPVSELELMADDDGHVHIYQSDYFTEDGFFIGLDAAEYITIGDYSSISVPQDLLRVDADYLQEEIDIILANAGVTLASPQDLTDELMSELSGGAYPTAQMFIDEVEANLINTQITSYTKQALAEITTFDELPQDMLEYYKAVKADEIVHIALHYGMTTNGYLIEIGYEDLDAYLEQHAYTFETQTKETLTSQYIAQTENLSVSTEDIDNFFNGADWSEYKGAWGENYIKSIVLADKVNKLFIK